MIVSRAEELGRLDELLAGLQAGTGHALVLRGAAGIGKTTLLDALAERCDDTVLVLRARGIETEAELAFAALADLLEPLLGSLAELPAPQSAALAGALAIGPPAPGDRFAICLAALGLVRRAAAEQPVLILVDDLQWLDAASRECVGYLGRRAEGRIAAAVTVREPAAGLGHAEAVELALGPLDPSASLELLLRVAPDATPAVAGALAEAAQGNPLALVELPATLTPEQRAGVAPLELPVAPGARLREAFAGRIAELTPAARRALLVAAAHAGDDATTIAAACTAAGTDVQLLGEAEERGLVRLGAGRVRFAHPIVRGAAYHGASPATRRRAHRALAGVCAGGPRAWHRAAATVGTDEHVARELEQVADGTAARRGYASASAALERAARLSPAPHDAVRRLVAAGAAAAAAGAPDRALALLGDAAAGAGDRATHAQAQHLRGRYLVWWGSPGEAEQLLAEESERVAGDDPVLAATMLADAANGATNASRYVRAEELARRAVALIGDRGDAPARAPVLAVLGWTLVLRGKAPEARPLLRRAEQLAEGLDGLGPHWPWLHVLLRARIPLEQLERARDESRSLCARAREAGAVATLSGALLIAADVAFRLGAWEEADRSSLEAIRVSGDVGQPAWRGFALSTRARLAAARGREQESREAALEALEIAESVQIGAGQRFVHGALGFLALGGDRVEAAIAELERVERAVAGTGLEEPTLVPWAPDLVEAYVRAGRTDDAGRVLALLERQAASSGSAFAAAAAARGRGMIIDDFEPAFAAALEFHEHRPMPFEQARTLLAHGRRLHRARRRAAARERLREALAGFDQLGAEAWAEQTRNELRAAGARRRAPRGRALTAQEQRVAAAVRRGASNREIAAELFLAPKTIDFHLRQIYRKVGLHSRSELVARLAREAATEPSTSAGPAAPSGRSRATS